MRALQFLFIVAASTILFRCDNHSDESANTRALITELSDTEWVLTNYKNKTLPAELQNRVTMIFPGEERDGSYRISGRAFINSYAGEFKVDKSTGKVTSINGVLATKMGGTNQDMNAEVEYLANLGKVTSYKISGDELTLYFGEDEVGYFSKK